MTGSTLGNDILPRLKEPNVHSPISFVRWKKARLADVRSEKNCYFSKKARFECVNLSTRGGVLKETVRGKQVNLVTLEGGVLARGAGVKHESISTGVE